MNSPSEKLTAAILERLVNEKILSKAEAKRLLPLLASGRMKASDWRAAVESSAPKKRSS